METLTLSAESNFLLFLNFRLVHKVIVFHWLRKHSLLYNRFSLVTESQFVIWAGLESRCMESQCMLWDAEFSTDSQGAVRVIGQVAFNCCLFDLFVW